MRKLVAGKLHGIHVTESNLNYHGSITLDPDHCEQAGILPMEFVEIWNKNSGARISTYVILGERGSRCCILNGAAARTCQPGDQIIIYNSVYLEESQLTSLKPKVLTFDEQNHVRDRLSYSVDIDDDGRYTFDILDGEETKLPIPLMVSGVQ
jgi:aspartate 1-decarboxylase